MSPPCTILVNNTYILADIDCTVLIRRIYRIATVPSFEYFKTSMKFIQS